MDPLLQLAPVRKQGPLVAQVPPAQ